jgi:hypothetical protein
VGDVVRPALEPGDEHQYGEGGRDDRADEDADEDGRQPDDEADQDDHFDVAHAKRFRAAEGDREDHQHHAHGNRDEAAGQDLDDGAVRPAPGEPDGEQHRRVDDAVREQAAVDVGQGQGEEDRGEEAAKQAGAEAIEDEAGGGEQRGAPQRQD